MKKILLFTLFLCVISLCQASSNLKLDLETCYRNYFNAINQYDLNNIKRCMSTYRYRHMKNYVASQKLHFPEDFIVEISYELVNIKKGKFLFAQENGNTASYVYHGRGYSYSKALIEINFVKEDNVWKYDGIKEKRLHEVKHLVESNKLDSLKEAYMPNGFVRSVETEVDSVDYKGWFNLQSEGYMLAMKINGVEQDLYNDVIENGVVLGGLKTGKNNVEIDLIPIANIEKRSIRVSIRGFISNAERVVLQLYQLEGQTHVSKDFEVKIYENAY